MKKTIKAVGMLALSSVLLFGCAEAQEPVLKEKDSQEVSNKKVKIETNQEIMLQVEDELTIDASEALKFNDSYIFNGFIGEDTLAFEQETGGTEEDSMVFIPAKVGHTFTLKSFEGRGFEIITFSREEGYVKLKSTSHN